MRRSSISCSLVSVCLVYMKIEFYFLLFAFWIIFRFRNNQFVCYKHWIYTLLQTHTKTAINYYLSSSRLPLFRNANVVVCLNKKLKMGNPGKKKWKETLCMTNCFNIFTINVTSTRHDPLLFHVDALCVYNSLSIYIASVFHSVLFCINCKYKKGRMKKWDVI